ncbi:hypothetical protein Taro_044668, partial [Colocasia esculenta]|nr:hypothetical protein [Colocasia esculenta]
MSGLQDGLASPQYELDKAVEAFGIGRIILSQADGYGKGDNVICTFCPLSVGCCCFLLKAAEQWRGADERNRERSRSRVKNVVPSAPGFPIMVSSSSSELERPCSSSSEQRTAGEAGQCCKREEEEVSWERQGS